MQPPSCHDRAQPAHTLPMAAKWSCRHGLATGTPARSWADAPDQPSEVFNAATWTDEAEANVPADLPVLITSGGNDPVGGGPGVPGARVLAERWEANGAELVGVWQQGLLFVVIMDDVDVRLLMNVSLTPELEQVIRDRVSSGRYSSASEVVRDALRLLEQRDETRQAHLDNLRADVAVGLAALDQGQFSDGGQVFDDLVDQMASPVARRV